LGVWGLLLLRQIIASAAHLYYFFQADLWPEIQLTLATIEADQEIIWVD
jgi:hypothetical protein